MRVSTVIFGSGLLAFSALCASGCGAPPAREETPIDCTATDIFDATWPVDDTWFSATDGTGQVSCDDPSAAGQTPQANGLCNGPRRATASIMPETPPEGVRCGSESALHLTAARNNDWGCLFGNYALATQTFDASAYDGVALWAKAAPGTTKTITIVLEDKYSRNLTDENDEVIEESSFCEDEEGAGGQNINPTTGQPGSGSVSVPGYIPSENACGNPYNAVVMVTEDWQLYRVPFASFTQTALPNRRIEGIDRASIRGMTLRAPKQAVVDMWIDDIAYYHELE
jgi:hypothetical protein